MHKHGINNNFFGNLQEFFVEGAHNNGWIFGQVNNLNQRFMRKRSGKACLFLNVCHTLANNSLTFCLRRNHVGIAHPLEQIIGAAYFEGTRCQETMTISQAVCRQASKHEVNQLFAKQRYKPPDRTAEVFTFTSPTLGFWPINAAHNAVQNSGEQILNRNGRSLRFCKHIINAVNRFYHQVFCINAFAACKAKRSFGGLTVFIKGNFCRRALEYFRFCFGCFRQIMCQNNQAAW